MDYTTADGVVTIEFAGGAKFILSRQSQMKQMWLAAGSHGFHYSWDAARGLWLDDKDGHERLRAWPRRYPSNSGIRWILVARSAKAW